MPWHQEGCFYRRTQERSPDWSKLVMVVSFPLANNWSKDRYVAPFWSTRCKHKFDREGSKPKAKTLPRMKMQCRRYGIHLATMKTKVYIVKKAEWRANWSSWWHYWTAAPCLDSRLLVIWEKLTPVYLGYYQSGFQLLIAGSLPNWYTYMYTYLLFS